MADSYVLDTSAVLALIDDEDGADEVEKLLRTAKKQRIRIFVSFVSLTEVRYITMQERDDVSADYLVGLIKSWPVNWVHSSEKLCLLAGRYKAKYPLSFADAFVAATADLTNSTLVHKDPEFESISGLVNLQPLPYKRPDSKSK